MNERMNIPRYLEGIDPADFDFMAGRADKEANPLYPVPVLMDKKELIDMYYVVCRQGNVCKLDNNTHELKVKDNRKTS